MLQMLKFDHPIPSCEIYALEWSGKWTYVYALNVPFELTNENTEELIVYEYISDLHLKLPNDVHPESVNLRVITLDDELQLIERQRDEDLKYRKIWLSKHPHAKPNTIILENKNYDHDALVESGVHYISFEVQKLNESTEFAAI